MTVYTYSLLSFTTSGGLVNIGALDVEIRNSSISNQLNGVTLNNLTSQVLIDFVGSLSSGDQTTLNGLVANHTNPANQPQIDTIPGGLNLSGSDITGVQNLAVTGNLDILGTLSASVGGDLSQTLPNPRVIAFTSGSTQILFNNIIDGQLLTRIGNTITSIATSSVGIPFATNVPVAVSKSIGSIGVAPRAAREDHRHDILTGPPSSLAPEQGNLEGSLNTLARADHIHNIPTATASQLTPEAGNSEGVAGTFSRSDHVHNIPSGTPSTITPNLSNAEGAAASFARTDHIHNIPTETPVSLSLGGTNTEGTAASFARSDHVHRITVFSQEVRDSSSITTSFGTPQVATGMTITPGAGTYLIFFSAWGDHDNNNATLSIGISIDGTLISGSERRTGGTANSDNDQRGLATQAIATITAGKEIRGVYWRSIGMGNVDLEDRILTVVRLDT